MHCTYDPDTRSGTPGAEARKVKGNIHWLSTRHAQAAQVRLYDRLFAVPQPGRATAQFDAGSEPARPATRRPRMCATTTRCPSTRRPSATILTISTRLPAATVTAYVEPALVAAPREARYQFERHGYFIADRDDHAPAHPVFNRAVTLRDSWGKEGSVNRR